MTIKVIVDRHSRAEGCGELFTFVCKYPWFIHPEVLRHRNVSHSVSSTRAIMITRFIAAVIRDPAMPESWGRNRAGMVAGSELDRVRVFILRTLWLSAMWFAAALAYLAYLLGAHKQIVNRFLMPWAHVNDVMTMTRKDLDAMLRLRLRPDADPTFSALAFALKRAADRSTPVTLLPGEWHTPLVSEFQQDQIITDSTRIRCSAAGCARTSYDRHDGKVRTVINDVALASRLITDEHWSPFEHQATPAPDGRAAGNLGKFWHQSRKDFEK